MRIGCACGQRHGLAAMTLQHTATNCNALQHTAMHCNTLAPVNENGVLMAKGAGCDATATHGNTLQHTATHCNTLVPVNENGMLTAKGAGCNDPLRWIPSHICT